MAQHGKQNKKLGIIIGAAVAVVVVVVIIIVATQGGAGGSSGSATANDKAASAQTSKNGQSGFNSGSSAGSEDSWEVDENSSIGETIDISEYEEVAATFTPTVIGKDGITYLDYLAMSVDDQYAYYKSHEDPEEFYQWYIKAKAEYDEAKKAASKGGDGTIDLSE